MNKTQTLERLRAILKKGPQHAEAKKNLVPFLDYDTQGNAELGKKLIASGEVGCLLIAGGQGTRLRFDGPKGMFPVSVIKKKSLFQLFAEKTIAAGKQAGRKLPLAIMTSLQNQEQTLSFFEKNHNFGLAADQLSFFPQGELPLLDHEGNPFYDAPGHVAMGPDGNGSSLKHFVESGIWDKWNSQGVRYVVFVLIDNPLADPYDAKLVGYHHDQEADVVVKCVTRQDPDEKVGVLIKEEGNVKVIEYTELPDEHRSWNKVCANLSLFSFSMDFIKRISQEEMPLHLAHKAVKCLDAAGDVVQPMKPNAWKFETFIFDVLPLANRVKGLLYRREECFAPLKNAEGRDSLATVQEALQARDRQIFQELSGKDVPDRPFELSQDFYYPTDALANIWKGRDLPEGDYFVGEVG